MYSLQKLMTVQDFAEQMTQNVSIGINKIYALVREPDFPSIKLGGRYYVLVEKINDWLEQQSQKRD